MIYKYKIIREKNEPFYDMFIHSSKDVEGVVRKILNENLDFVTEKSLALYLNNANKVIGYSDISHGGLTSTVVDIRIIAKYAIDTLSTAVILVHTHPSDKCTPSMKDERITNDIKRGLDTLNIKLLDHVIISDTNCYSFSDNGLI